MNALIGRSVPWVVALGLLASPAQAAEAPSREAALAAIQKAVEFFRSRVATEGGYLWRYSEDLKKREGEGRAAATQVWVQPPGTPSVGAALLRAHEAGGGPSCLEAARAAGDCLVRGQLRSGGWDYHIDFECRDRTEHNYRVDPPVDAKQRNASVLDDDTTQAALRFLMRLDKTLGFKDAKVHEAVEYGLSRLVEAQYPNGAWPQRFDRPPLAEQHPVKKAGYPESWPRTWPRASYSGYYTLNDNVLSDTVETLLEAARTYNHPHYRAAAERAGNFLLLAQMPDPQPAWAQQYDPQMCPAWARKFEPPAVTGGESRGAMQTLLRLYRETGDRKYLGPIPRALAYLRASLLPDGRLARFYELKTNRPLYFTRQYELTYSDGDVPTHYAFKISNWLDGFERDYCRALEAGPGKPQPKREGKPPARPAEQVRAVIAAQDAQGRWVEDGRLKYHGQDDPTRRVIDCATFIRNLGVLSDYLR